MHPTHYDTVILGAGISGLACASRLLENESYQKEKSLLVLEGRERIGGRIESVYVNGNRLDTGANWIHGVGTKDRPNPLVQILPGKRTRELNGSVSFRPSSTAETDTERPLIEESDVGDDWIKVDSLKPFSTKYSDGSLVIPPHISGDLFGALWTLIGSLREKASNTSPDDARNITMLEAIMADKSFINAFEDIPAEFHRTLRALPQFIENMEAGPLNSTSSEHSIERRGMGLLEYALNDFEGEQVFVNDGYTAIVEEVGKHVIKQGRVKLGVEAKSVEAKSVSWDAGPVVVSTDEETYTANRVVCTLPLGVLKDYVAPEEAFAAPLFSPHLPPDYLEAISWLGFGTLDKVFLVYSQPWWTEDPYASILKKGLVSNSSHDGDASPRESGITEPDSILGFTNELKGLDIGPGGSIRSGIRALSVVNLHSLTGFPVLSSFVSCANAAYVESLSDDDASMIVHRSLTEWFGREPPLPDAVHVTRWSQDKFSLGSYSHMITGLSKNSYREIFQRPLINKDGYELRFAGEHTSLNHFATVHGALLSGWREADAILESENKIASTSS